MQKFHKWCYNAVQGLAIFCLWWECGNLSKIYIGSPYFGAIVGLFVIGWALGYNDKYENKKVDYQEMKRILDKTNKKD